MDAWKNILVIVPSYNEEKSISEVVKSVQEHVPMADILVVNDGSRDNTRLMAEQQGVFVLDLPFNLGIGGAVQTGFKFAYKLGYEIAVQVDGDGQHRGDQVKKLIDELRRGECDMVIGSRFLGEEGYKSTKARMVGIKVFSWVITLICGKKYRDTTSGFRAYNRKVIEYVARFYPTDYPEAEMVVLLHREGFRMKEIPVKMEARKGGESSIKLFQSIYYMVKVLLSILVTSVRRRILAREV